MNCAKKKVGTLYTLLCVLGTTCFVQCSTFNESTSGSDGTQSISDTQSEITFESTVDTTIYKSVAFTNRSAETYIVNNLAFVDNVCGAFSVYSITDSDDQELYTSDDTISIAVASSATININIQFAPASCDNTAYTTTLVIYYADATTTTSATVSLLASVEGTAATVNPTTCSEDTTTYYDEYDNPTKRTLPELESGKNYYLKVNMMSAYLQTTGGFSQFATQVGTNINLDDIDPANWFVPVYIPFTTDADGKIVIKSFNECMNFRMPSPITDNFFLGADVMVTLSSDTSGTIDRSVDPGTFDVPVIRFTLNSFINDSNSLLQSSEGYFNIDIDVALTTGTTAENSFLSELTDLTDDDGNSFLNISGDTIVGKKIRHGTITLVGIGSFVSNDNVELSNEAESAILENEAYLFIQIEGLVTQAQE